VVVAIIALLIAILLPSLETARRQSKRAYCLHNLKVISTASRSYEADDMQGWGIPTHHLQFEQPDSDPTYIGAYEWGGKSGVGRTDFIGNDPKNQLNSKYGTKAGFGPASRPLNEQVYGKPFTDFLSPSFSKEGATQDTKLDLSVFHCPGDNGPPRGGHCEDWTIKGKNTTSFDWFGTSYAANIFMIATTDGSKMVSNSPYLRPLTRVPTPARTLYYEENIGRWAWAAREDQCDFLVGIDVGPTKSLGSWHEKDWVYARSFCDTHAEIQEIYIKGTEDGAGYAKHYRREFLEYYPLWFGVDMPEDFWRCVIIRGDGWTKDTLPAEVIVTNLDWPGSQTNRPSYEDCVEP